jgi:hypothetical protein
MGVKINMSPDPERYELLRHYVEEPTDPDPAELSEAELDRWANTLSDAELDRWGDLEKAGKSIPECQKIIDAERGTLGPSESVPDLEFYTIRELRARVAAEGPRQWLARGIIPAGQYGMHAGPPKAQKTMNATDSPSPSHPAPTGLDGSELT